MASTSTEASTGVGGRTDVHERPDAGAVLSGVSEWPPEEILVEFHRSAVGVAVDSVGVDVREGNGSDGGDVEDAAR